MRLLATENYEQTVIYKSIAQTYHVRIHKKKQKKNECIVRKGMF